jgi:hypothetical protein
LGTGSSITSNKEGSITMAKCENEGCDKEATHSVTLNIPAAGVPIDLHTPIKMYIGVELCREHADSFGEKFTWEENDSLRDAIEASVAALGGSPADFDRSFHAVCSLDSQGYQQFLLIKEQRRSS